MSHIRLLLAVASALALTACAPTEKSRFSGLAPAPAANYSAEPAQPAGAGLGTDTVGTYPDGNADGVQTSNAGAGREAPTTTGPDGTIWLKPDAANETYRIDADSCYSYALAQTNHDARIESDAGAVFNEPAGGIGLVQLRRRMSNFARTNRIPRLFGDCMEAKGYTRG